MGRGYFYFLIACSALNLFSNEEALALRRIADFWEDL
jgi:hypothetical protein